MSAVPGPGSSPDLRSIVAGLTGEALVLDPGLHVVAATEELLAVTGADRDEIIGRHLLEVFPARSDDPAADRGPVLDGVATVAYLVHRVADVTDVVALVDAMGRPSEGDLSTVGHDLNNLHGVILNYCALLARQWADDAATMADLDEIRAAAEKAAALTAELHEPG